MAAPILYCHCAYARIVPEATKAAVLDGLARSGVAFEAVPDLCEMAARRDPRLTSLAGTGSLRIAACYPRAVKWLLASAGAEAGGPEPTVLNMRTGEADAIVRDLVADGTESRP